MLVPFLWIIGCYAVCVGAVHFVHWSKRDDPPQNESWIIVTRNHQHKVEWVLRSLLLVSWMRGISLQLYVLDRESTDDTLRIVEQLARKAEVDWRVISADGDLQQVVTGMKALPFKVIDLDTASVPMMSLRYL